MYKQTVLFRSIVYPKLKLSKYLFSDTNYSMTNAKWFDEMKNEWKIKESENTGMKEGIL